MCSLQSTIEDPLIGTQLSVISSDYYYYYHNYNYNYNYYYYYHYHSTLNFKACFCKVLISFVFMWLWPLYVLNAQVHHKWVCKVDQNYEHVAEEHCDTIYFLTYFDFVCKIHVWGEDFLEFVKGTLFLFCQDSLPLSIFHHFSLEQFLHWLLGFYFHFSHYHGSIFIDCMFLKMVHHTAYAFIVIIFVILQVTYIFGVLISLKHSLEQWGVKKFHA